MAAVSLVNKTLTRSALAGNPGYLTGYEWISSVTVGSLGASSVSFTEIPQGYRHLQIRGVARNASTSTFYNLLYIRFNNDSGNNYAWHYLIGNGSAASSTATTSTNSISCGYSMQNGGLANVFDATVVDVLDYSNGVKNKTVRSLAGHDANASGNGEVGLQSGVWLSTAPVTSLTLFQGTFNLTQFSTFSLYGIR